MLRHLVSPLCIILILSAPTISAADSDAWKKDGITVCKDYPAGVYRPYNTLRRMKLAAAYFVNPALPDKSEIVNVYSLADFVKGQGMDRLWDSLQKGTIKVAAPVIGANAYVPIDAKDFSLLSALCPDRASASQDKVRPASVSYKNLIDFSTKSSFRGSIDKVGLENLGAVFLLSDQTVSGVSPKYQYISWDPNEAVNVSVGTMKSGTR